MDCISDTLSKATWLRIAGAGHTVHVLGCIRAPQLWWNIATGGSAGCWELTAAACHTAPSMHKVQCLSCNNSLCTQVAFPYVLCPVQFLCTSFPFCGFCSRLDAFVYVLSYIIFPTIMMFVVLYVITTVMPSWYLIATTASLAHIPGVQAACFQQ